MISSPKIALAALMLALFAGALFSEEAQAQAPGLVAAEIVATPENPAPGQEVSFELRSFSLDLNRATISWSVDGKPAASGVGRTRISAVAGKLGSTLSVTAAIRTAAGQNFSASAALSVASIDLLWQASSYTPPFYRGKALPAADASLTVTAVPHLLSGGRELSPESLIYTWRRGTTVLGEQSGRGKMSVTVAGPKLNDAIRVSVEVSSADRSVRGSNVVTIAAAEPQALLYADDPLLGLRLERALGASFALSEKEARLTAMPYFLSAARRADPNLEYRFSLDGAPVAAANGDRGSVILRQVAEGRGIAGLSLSVQHLTRILQSAAANVQITFGNE